MHTEAKNSSSVMIRLSPELRKQIEDFRGQQRPIPTAAQVVRDALTAYLKAMKRQQAEKTG
jgi:hypothetical protein